MYNENKHHDSCVEGNCNSGFTKKEDLLKYKQHLERELEIVNKALQDENEDR